MSSKLVVPHWTLSKQANLVSNLQSFATFSHFEVIITMFASQMARLGFSYHLLLRPGFEPTSIELHRRDQEP